MSQAKIANTIKRQLQGGLITRAQAIKALREQTDYNTAFILSAVKRWEKRHGGPPPNKNR